MAATPRSDGDGSHTLQNVDAKNSPRQLRTNSPRPTTKGTTGKMRPDLPNLINHLMVEYFAQEENFNQFFKDADGITAGKFPPKFRIE